MSTSPPPNARWHTILSDSPASQTALGVSILCWVLLGVQTDGWFSPSGWSLFRAGANLGAWTLDGGEWWRLLTYASLHGGLIHLGFNGFILYRQAPVLERAWSSWRFALIYAVAAVGGGLASALTHGGPSVGASGAILGIFGALLVILHRNPHPQARAHRNGLFRMILLLFAIGFFSRHLGIRIDNAAHAGGLIAGGLVAALLHWARTRPQAERVLRPLAWILFVPLMLAPVARPFLARTLPVERGETDAEVLSTLRSAWAPCREATASGAHADAVAPCERFREIGFDRPMGYLYVATLHEALGNPRAAERERRMLRRLDPERADRAGRDLLPAEHQLPLMRESIDRALRSDARPRTTAVPATEEPSNADQ